MDGMEDSGSPTIRYEDLLPTLRTGDVFLFHGDSLISRVVERVTGSRFSHAAMIIRPDPAKPPMLWQTGPDPIVEDEETHSMHGGAQLGLLDADLKLMGIPKFGDVPFVRRLQVERGPDFETLALQAVADIDGRPFPSNPEMLENWLLGLLHIATSDRTLFCAQLVAATFVRMGLLPLDPPVNFYDPKDFSTEYDRLPWLKGATLGPQLLVIQPPQAAAGAQAAQATPGSPAR
jgi:hypothetical protein